MRRITSAIRGFLTSREYRSLFIYRRWASERLPYKSQHGQDWWVDRTLAGKRGGFFLDLAAADGVWISNTYFLEKHRGWQGICIEPNPEMFSKLCAERSATCVNRCISDRVETIEFRIDTGVVGGIVAEDTDNKPGSGGTIMTMETVTLTEVLDEFGAPRYIDYFSLDVEGAEDRVIRGLDFDRYEFGLLTVERPSEYLDSTLSHHGYRRIKKMQEDVFYSGRIITS